MCTCFKIRKQQDSSRMQDCYVSTQIAHSNKLSILLECKSCLQIGRKNVTEREVNLELQYILNIYLVLGKLRIKRNPLCTVTLAMGAAPKSGLEHPDLKRMNENFHEIRS